MPSIIELAIQSLQKENAQLREDLMHLKKQIGWFIKQIFGANHKK